MQQNIGPGRDLRAWRQRKIVQLYYYSCNFFEMALRVGLMSPAKTTKRARVRDASLRKPYCDAPISWIAPSDVCRSVRVPADRDHRFQAIVITHSRAS
jgi:hypothetical protein